MNHQMILMGTTRDDAEEWGCPVCGRRVLLRWPPCYERVVLDVGDETVVHAVLNVSPPVPVPDLTDSSGLTGLSTEEHSWLREHGIEWGDPAGPRPVV